jgi:aryl-alcohol dehydrogenase-like predicted oxidoreductase
MSTPLPTRRLGSAGPVVSCIGLGCMGMSFAYGQADEAESLRVLHRYVELGGSFLDTAEIYGPFDNEILVGKFLRELRGGGKPTVATKFGFDIDPVTRERRGVDSRPQTIRRVCEQSLGRLGLETIDLFYQHRVDPNVPIEEVAGTLAELKRAGKIRYYGLSEAGPQTLRRAHAVHPVTALQSEYSLWTRDIETNGVLATCRELKIGFVPYSPLGRGFLTGSFQRVEDLPPDDWRRTNPRFSEGALRQNLKLADHVKTLAAAKGCTPAQLALAWVLSAGEDVVPIPGTKRVKYLEDNLGAANVKLSQDDLQTIDRLFPPGAAEGERYPAEMMQMLNL